MSAPDAVLTSTRSVHTSCLNAQEVRRAYREQITRAGSVRPFVSDASAPPRRSPSMPLRNRAECQSDAHNGSTHEAHALRPCRQNRWLAVDPVPGSMLQAAGRARACPNAAVLACGMSARMMVWRCVRPRVRAGILLHRYRVGVAETSMSVPARLQRARTPGCENSHGRCRECEQRCPASPAGPPRGSSAFPWHWEHCLSVACMRTTGRHVRTSFMSWTGPDA